MITIEHLTKRFGRYKAVNDLSFAVEEGEALALWGPNGAGKTTIIRCLLGLLRYRGRITVAGLDARKQGKAARRVLGYVPQELTLYDDLSATESLHLFARLKRVPTDRVAIVLDEVGLSAQRRKRVRAMSGGMKQRLALAAALLADPPLLLLDEMTSNLDAGARADFMSLLLRLKDRGKTVLYTTHRLNEVQHLADRVLALDAGKLVTTCAPEGLAEALSLRCTLKVIVNEAVVKDALAVLAERGFTATPNGSGIVVRVRPDQKAAPLRALGEMRIEVSDFEVANDVREEAT
jgi:ABC-type multidrug transport system ATPase subunit